MKLKQLLRKLGPPVKIVESTSLYEAAVLGRVGEFVQLAKGKSASHINAVITKDLHWHPLQWVLSQVTRDKQGTMHLSKQLKECCVWLLSQGVQVHYLNRKGYTCLHTFARVAWDDDRLLHEQILRLFLAQGANLDSQSKSGETPLHLAILDGVVESVKMLLSLNANPNLTNRRGDSPLHYIFHRKQADPNSTRRLLEVLLSRGANPHVKGTMQKDCSELIATLPEPQQADLKSILGSFFYINSIVTNFGFLSFFSSRKTCSKRT